MDEWTSFNVLSYYIEIQITINYNELLSSDSSLSSGMSIFWRFNPLSKYPAGTTRFIFLNLTIFPPPPGLLGAGSIVSQLFILRFLGSPVWFIGGRGAAATEGNEGRSSLATVLGVG